MTKSKNVKKRKLLVLAGKLGRTGGVETHLLNFCKSLKEEYLITIIVSSRQNLLSDKIKQISSNGLKLKVFDCKTNPVQTKFNYLRMVCYVLFKRIAGFNFLYTNGASGNVMYFLGRLLKFKKWIHHHHSDISHKVITRYTQHYIEIFDRADYVILCTEQQKLNFKDFKFKATPVFLPYCKQEPERNVKKKYDGELAFLGRILVSKGINYILALDDTWLQMHNLSCKLYGNLELDDSPDIEKKIVSANGQIKYMGSYDADKDLDEILGNVDMVIIPSTGAEGLPLVFTEAISRGIPVVGFNGGGLRDYTEFDDGVLISDPDIELYKKNILEMQHRILSYENLSQKLITKYRNTLSSSITIQWWKNN